MPVIVEVDVGARHAARGKGEQAERAGRWRRQEAVAPPGDIPTIAIVHTERRDGGDRVVLDYLSERRPPFSPETVVPEFAATPRAFASEPGRDRTSDPLIKSFVAVPSAPDSPVLEPRFPDNS